MIAPAASPAIAGLEWVCVALAGAALGSLLARLVGPLVEDAVAEHVHRRLALMGGLVACALWGWEVVAGGQLPHLAAEMVVPRPVVAARCAAHLVLAALLAAAAWVDLRHRVIPDVITVPGLMAGLAWTAFDPEVLLPVHRFVARSFAAPLVDVDLLGAFGGIATAAVPSWLATPGGLVAAWAAFAAWWFCCTAPADEDEESPGSGCWWREPRVWVLMTGATIIAAAWVRGGVPWTAAVSSLVGIVVAAGLVWLTRIGASWALGQEALGFGDVTLMAMAGAWLGWQACVLACFVAVFIGLAHGLWQMATGRGNELPFGPSLCAGIAFVVVAWRPVWGTTGAFFERPGELAAVGAAVILLTALSLAAWSRVRGHDPPLQG
jgi:leader peptidase (prepilin peptidase)/N-methyltransferase